MCMNLNGRLLWCLLPILEISSYLVVIVLQETHNSKKIAKIYYVSIKVIRESCYLH